MPNKGKKQILLKLILIPEIGEKERNFGLDLLRSTAICLVLLAHGSYLLHQPPKHNLILWNGGFYGVELFFVLSGFLIGSILFKILSNQNARFNIQLVLNFWIRRWFRTLPNYFLFLILNLTLFQWLFGMRDFNIRYFFFLQNFAWPAPYLMNESWSLAIEEWFYIFFPLVMLIFLCLPVLKKKALLTGLVVYLLVSTVIRFTGAVETDLSWDQGFRKVVIFRLDSIGYGVLIAYLNFFYNTLLEKYKKLMLVTGCGMVLFSIAVFSYSVLTIKDTFFNKTVLFIVTDLGLALLLPYFKGIKVKSGFLPYAITHISIVSYSIYLIHHSFVIQLLHELFPSGTLPWYILYALYIIITFFLSTLVYKYFERPMTALRSRFTKHEANLTQQIAAPGRE